MGRSQCGSWGPAEGQSGERSGQSALAGPEPTLHVGDTVVGRKLITCSLVGKQILVG